MPFFVSIINLYRLLQFYMDTDGGQHSCPPNIDAYYVGVVNFIIPYVFIFYIIRVYKFYSYQQFVLFGPSRLPFP